MSTTTGNDLPLQTLEKKKNSLTPHELVRRHMDNPDEPITDEDMENIDLTIQMPDNTKNEADREADELEGDNTGTAYDPNA